MNRKLVALLPMKAHSERIKGKNFRDFNGRPLFWWVLDSLISIPEIQSIVINTDARHILKEKGLLESPRIIIRDREPSLCGDDVSMNLILASDVAHTRADMYLMTHTTNPLLSIRTTKKAIDTFITASRKAEADSLFSVNRHQTRFYRADGSAVNHDPKNLIKTQDLEPWFEENSNLYIFTAQSFAKTKARIGTKPIMFETPRLESIDIDNEADWQLAELAWRYLNNPTTSA